MKRMHHLTKDLLSTKITKATEGSEIFDYKLRALRTTMLKSFRSLRKLFRRWLPFSYECLGLFSRQDAKNAKFGFIFSFAAFAPLREIFRVLVAAQTRCGLRRKMSGSAFSSGATIPTASFRFIAGKDLVKEWESSPGYYRQFCGRCGSPILKRKDKTPEIIRFRPGTLDGDPAIKIFEHLHIDSRAPWIEIKDDSLHSK